MDYKFTKRGGVYSGVYSGIYMDFETLVLSYLWYAQKNKIYWDDTHITQQQKDAALVTNFGQVLQKHELFLSQHI